MDVHATRTIAASPVEIYTFLENPDRHWQLLGRRLQPLRPYDGERSQVRLRGPLGIHRTLWIRMAVSDPPHELVGRVEAGGGTTIGTVRWEIREHTASSSVTLTARTEVAAWLDRLLLVCGGAHWLRRSLEVTLRALDERLAPD
ncbi:SRPBCC family protein [Conexibacter sp. CPCC 206217]|uniref:SRPBCC family protein n=1 Tax=Conexibacter sp. CPCC 206217 TaxID=3064574 RepID=UPI002718DDFE|nr:SRPBCC family protein [Conexibacter sp. CPCC 206217]MDO8214082.1 SRPBCC family protein [Conexibacter sp. CPCC 206217]